jgi:tetratricopeptide (TPR) repeat protein
MLTNMLILYRQWGYSPPFLVEGLAGYFEFNSYEIKKIKEQKEIPSLSSLFTSSGYYSSDSRTAEIVSASFVKFLADSYGIGRVKELYDNSDDLFFQKNIELIFELPLDTLEAYWHHYIDTATISRGLFDFYAGRAGALFKDQLQIEYYEEMLKLDSTRRDSIDTRQKLYMIYYRTGRYYEAEEGYRILTQLDSSKAVYWQVIGNLNLINGNPDIAWQAFDSVYALDTTYVSAKLLQAEILSLRGDTSAAIELAEQYYSFENSPPAKIEFLLLLGNLYQGKGENYDSTKAHRYFSDALAWCKEMIRKTPNEPAFKYRAGLALMGLGEYAEANDYLELAWFTERRAYFLGHILLERGKVNDKLGNREAAINFYQECLANPSASKHQELARQYLDKPFTN